MGGQRTVPAGFKVGDEVVIKSRSHPHAGETGVIRAEATGGAAGLGFDWEVELDGAYAGGAFVRTADLAPRRKGPSTRASRRGRSK